MDNKTVYYKPLPPKPATLLIIERGKPITLVSLDGSMTLGRASEKSTCDIKIASGIVSRNHGEFIYEDVEGIFYYRDNNSLNGTFYNGVKLEQLNERGTRAVRLSDGDILRIDCENLMNPRSDAVIIIFSTAFSVKETWKRYPLDGIDSVKIGRGISDGICLTDFMASRSHAVMVRAQNTWHITDSGSVNGLAVNREQLEGQRELHIFDVIRIANTTLIFLGNEVIYNEVQMAAPQPEQVRANRSVVMSVNIDEVKVRKFNSIAKKTLLSHINLDVEAGDFVLILGGAGAGKTTFIKSLMGSIKRTGKVEGQVLFDNMDLYKNFRMLKHKIGLVPQFSTTRDNDTVYNTIMDAANIKLAGEYSNAEIRQRVDNVIGKLMLTSLTGNLVKNLSGGQKKRVEVAIQAIGDQEVFVLDEPDSGMDYATRVDLMTNLHSCTDSGGVVMVISHSPDDAAHLFTKVIVLAKSQRDEVGRLAYYGDVENAYKFFGVGKLSDIVMEINYEGGHGRADEFIDKFENTRRG